MSVVVYTLPSCVQCDYTKRLMDKLDIAYDVVDLSKDEAAAQLVKSLGYASAPVVVADGEHWSGFKIDKIKALVEL